VHLAVKHGLAVQVVPLTDGKIDESRAVVDGMMLRDAEAAAQEHGGEAWLASKRKRVISDQLSVISGRSEEEDDERVRRAKAVAAGEGDPLYQDDGEKREEVIEQEVEHAAWVDLTPVKRVAMWAVSSGADPMDAPDFVPKWARKLGVEGMWSEIDEIVNWVMELRKK
jgi:hypothetical protein